MPYADPEKAREQKRRWKKEHPEYTTAYNKMWWQRNPEKLKAKQARHNERTRLREMDIRQHGICIRCKNAQALPNHWKCDACAKADREKHFRRQYGITIAERDAMLAQQGGRCACCGTAAVSGFGWHVDHDHETGRIRGVLCHRCNVGLGHFKDSPDLLAKAIDYLRRHRLTAVS